jgi:acyl-CoA synthetase (AMP-forming)/AMP-acid ligase II
MSQAINLLDKLEKWATETPNKIAMSFLDDKGDILRRSSKTYSDIALQSSNLAEYLRSPESNIKSGDRSVISVIVATILLSYHSVSQKNCSLQSQDSARISADSRFYCSIFGMS